MLGKKTCKNCGRKVSQKDNFCPNCGAGLKDSAQRQKDWGLLGNDDNINQQQNQNQDPMGMGGGMLNKMIGGVVKMLEKEMQKEMQKNMQNQNKQEKDPFQGKTPPTNFKLMINGKEVDLGGNKSQSDNQQQQKQKELTQKDLPSNKLKDFAKKQKREPSTSVKRFSDRVIYEINMPGVESQEELSITKLENSIEVRGKSKDSSYFKVIPIDSPITGYNFKKGKLSLEFSE